MRSLHINTGLNHADLMKAVRAGQAQAVLDDLAQDAGVINANPAGNGKFTGILTRDVGDMYNADGKVIGKTFTDLDRVAFDAQPELVTVSNAGIPAWLSTKLDPRAIEVVVSPMKAAQIAGEVKKGSWVSTVETFIVVESDGQVSAYGDYSNAGNADTNINFPQRQSFHYQVFTKWGEKELAYTGLAGVDLASRKNTASVLVLMKFQNKSYFFGIAGLQNYGMLNAPDLLPSILPSTAWDAATADQCYQNILDLYTQLVRQGNGVIENTDSFTLACSPTRATNFQKTNQYGLNVYKLLGENFPNITIKTAPEYSTSSGELMQFVLNEYEGQETWTNAFTEKMRAHAVVVGSSSFSQKKSQGTWGNILFRPVFVASSLG